MPHTPVEGLPAKLIVGDTWTWKRSLAEHLPADGWALLYEFSIDNDDVFKVEAATDGAGFLVTVAAGVTKTLKTGVWRWAELVTRESGTERYTLQVGKIEFYGVFRESHAERWVRILREAIESLISGKVQSVQVNGRARTMLDLEALRKMLKDAEAQAEQDTTPGRLGPQVAAVFQSPGFPGVYPLPPYPHGGSL